MKRMKRILTCAFMLSALFLILTVSCNEEDISKDDTTVSEGWTTFTPATDSRILYVSASGDDATAEVYTAVQVTDPFNPATVKPFKTFTAAYAQAREGYPDWILLKRGDTFSANLTMRAGRGANEFALIGAYGSEGAMPVVNPLNIAKSALYIPALEYSAITGIDFYAVSRNPLTPGYSIAGSTGFDGTTDEVIKHLLIEGCRFRFFDGNEIQIYNEGVIEDVVIRRTVISDSYSSGTNHTQGLFMHEVNGVLLEENIFDHNGWYAKAPGTPGTATMFNHNTYFSACHNVVFKKNIFTRGSSMGNKFTANYGEASSVNITLTDNLYVDNEVGVGLGGNTLGQYRFKNVIVEGNVFTEIGRSQQTDRTLGWALDIIDWDGGKVAGNYFVNFTNPAVTNIHGIYVEGGVRNVQIQNNIIYNLNPHGNSNSAPALVLAKRTDPVSPKSNITVSNNIFQEPVKQLLLMRVDNSAELSAFSFQNNKYFSANESTAFRIENTTSALAPWKTTTGDNSTFTSTTFAEPTRSISTYMQSVGGTATIDAFFDACRAQGRYNWSDKYTADAVNAYVKAGF